MCTKKEYQNTFSDAKCNEGIKVNVDSFVLMCSIVLYDVGAFTISGLFCAGIFSAFIFKLPASHVTGKYFLFELFLDPVMNSLEHLVKMKSLEIYIQQLCVEGLKK